MLRMGKGKKRANGEGGIGFYNGRWVARHTIRTAAGPKRKAYYGSTRAEAHGKLVAGIAERNSGERHGALSIDADKIAVGAYLTRWLEDSARHSVAQSTYTRYEQYIRLHLAPALGSIELRKLTPGHVEMLRNALLVDKELAPSTVTQALLVLSMALNQAVKWEMVSRNVAALVKRPKSQQHSSSAMRSLTEEDAARLVEVVRGTRYEALYTVALKCGLRQGELCALKWEDLNLDKGFMVVRRSVNTNRKERVWSATKSGEARSIRLSVKLVEALRRHKKLQLEERMTYPGVWRYPELVFPSEKGDVLAHGVAGSILNRHLAAAGLSRGKFHDLRNTCATLMLRSGFTHNLVAKILGHKDPAITLRKYAHVLSDMEEAGAEKLDKWAF